MLTVAPDVILTPDKRREKEGERQSGTVESTSFKERSQSNFHLLDCPKSSFFSFGKMALVAFSCL